VESKETIKIILLFVIAGSMVFLGFQIKELIYVLEQIAEKLGYINTNIQ
jgi:hypothetical protein